MFGMSLLRTLGKLKLMTILVSDNEQVVVAIRQKNPSSHYQKSTQCQLCQVP